MESIQNVRSNVKQPESRTCETGTRYSYNHRRLTDDDGTYWLCDQYWFPTGEYDMVRNGYLPAGVQWTAELHKIFREYQHSRTDDLYNYAQRMLRSTQDTRYSDYITALDQWNAQVSALAETFSTSVPELPASP